MNDETVYRTAPATPGLLNIELGVNTKSKSVFGLLWANQIGLEHGENKIEIWPIDALFEVLGITSFLIYLVFQFERYSNLSDIQFWMTFQFEWHSILSEIPFWVTLHFE